MMRLQGMSMIKRSGNNNTVIARGSCDDMTSVHLCASVDILLGFQWRTNLPYRFCLFCTLFTSTGSKIMV